MKQVTASVISNQEILPGIYILWLDSPAIAAAARPGQFVMVRVGQHFEPLLRRPLAIHRLAPLRTPTQFALAFAVVGRGTKWLAQRIPGDMLDVLGPLGNGFAVNSGHLLMVAGGMGIAPLVALAEQQLIRGAKITLVIGAASRNQIYPDSLLPGGISLISATEDGSVGEKAMASDLVPGLIGDADQVFACGPISMYESMHRLALLSTKSVQVSMEARMGCGFGVCLGCAIETKQGMRLVCRDGPVFELRDIIWKVKQGGY